MENAREKFIRMFSIFKKNEDNLREIEKECMKRIELADTIGNKEDSIKYRETLLRNSINFLLSSQEAVPIMSNIVEKEETFAYIPMKELVRHCEKYLNLTRKTIEILNSDIFDLTYGENLSVKSFLKIINQNR